MEQVGADVADLSGGEGVLGFLPAGTPVVHNGAWAEFIVVPESAAVRQPKSIDITTAGAAPLAATIAVTAVDALSSRPATRC